MSMTNPKPKVVNVRTAPKGSYVYVGRKNCRAGFPETIYGNPFFLGEERTRAAKKLERFGLNALEILGPLWHVMNRKNCVDAYREWIMQQPELIASAKENLRGHDLGCWCAPEKCHADILLEIANA